jgi:large exoprotein involved in heme utilization and adhesion
LFYRRRIYPSVFSRNLFQKSNRNPIASQLLTVNPSALLFNQINAASIQNNATTGLQVPEGRSLLLVGGNVNLDAGVVLAANGRVELGGLAAPGTVSLDVNGNNLSLQYPENVAKADITLGNQARVDVNGVGGGSVQIQGNNVTLNNASTINSFTLDNQNGQEIFIRATKLDVVGNSSITAFTGGAGKGSNVVIKTTNLAMQDNSVIQTGSISSGKAGDITVEATDSINLNQSRFGTITVGQGDGSTTAAGGNLSIQTQNLSLENNSSIVGSTFLGTGNASNLKIAGANSIYLDNSAISTSSFGAGIGGDISIDTKSLRLVNGGAMFTNTFDPSQDTSIIFPLIDPNLIPLIQALIGTINPENVGKADSGNITINASDSMELIGISPDGLNPSILSTSTFGAGNAGKITITTGKLSVRDGAVVSTGTVSGSQGKGGDLFINASDRVEIIGKSDSGLFFLSSLLASTQGSGDAGNLQITTPRLFISNGGLVSTFTYGMGKGGDIIINAPEYVEVGGELSDDQIYTRLSTETAASGNAGNMKIDTRELRVRNGASVSSGTFVDSQGAGGNLVVNAIDSVLLTGGGNLSTQTLGSGSAGDLTVDTAGLIIQDGGFISAATFAQGVGGNIQLKANTLSLTNQAAVTARSQGEGKAGNININLSDNLQANNSNITTAAIQAGGGDISITAQTMRLRNDSDIRTNLSTGQGSGGNIFLSADTIIALEDSDILAFAPEGQGGNITFDTRAFLSVPLYQTTTTTSDAATLQALDGNNRVDVNASGAVNGSIIGVPDISFLQNSLTELPENLIDANVLIANSCIARRNQRQSGTFFITGSGGLPERPGDAPLSSFATGTMQNIPNKTESTNSSRPWKLGDPIIEPTGVYRLANGQRVLSRECH